MTQDLNRLIEEMNSIIATLEEAKRLNGNRGYDTPLRLARRKLDELLRRAVRS